MVKIKRGAATIDDTSLFFAVTLVTLSIGVIVKILTLTVHSRAPQNLLSRKKMLPH